MRQDQEATDSDDDDWLAALAGRPRASADRGVNAEAALLREASRRWPAAAPAMSAEQAQAQLAGLLAAARADPRLAASARRRGGSSCAMCEALRRWWSQPSRLAAGAVAAAALALLAVAVLPWQAMAPARPDAVAPADTLRGAAADGVQRLRSADPRALRDRIADELASAGVPVTRYERLGRFGLDAEWPVPPSAGGLSVLRAHGLMVPVGNGLAVEVEAGP